MAGCIYLITNKLNKKVYVGQTIKTAEYRWSQHIKCSKYAKYAHYSLYRAFNKYGIENFTFEVIVDNVPDDLLDDLETNCIAAYNGILGYNMVAVGSSMKGYKFSEKVLAHLSSIRKGKEPTNKGKKFPELSGANHPRSKRVTQVSTGTIFESALAAAIELGVCHSSVIGSCKGRKGKVGGSYFEYTDYPNQTITRPKENLKGGNNGMARSVVCEQTGDVYPSLVEAATALGLKVGSVQAVCRGTRVSVFGYTFKYKE